MPKIRHNKTKKMRKTTRQTKRQSIEVKKKHTNENKQFNKIQKQRISYIRNKNSDEDSTKENK